MSQRLLAMMVAALFALSARGQANSHAASYNAPGTLAYYLSTNTAAYTNGYAGNFNDEWEVSGWDFRDYRGSNFFYLTNVTWSAHFWLKGVRGLSATPIGISNNLGGETLLTLISPRHYVRAHHIGALSYHIAFLDTNNVLCLRVPLQEVQVGNSDTDVGILNADVPPSVGFLPVIPANFTSYLPATGQGWVQGIGMNRGLLLFGQSMSFGDPFVFWNLAGPAPFGLPTHWTVGLEGGDSSNPEMLLISNQLVLVSHNYGVNVGPNYGLQIDAINRQMHYLSTNNAVGSDYQLTQFSLTNWPVINP